MICWTFIPSFLRMVRFLHVQFITNFQKESLLYFTTRCICQASLKPTMESIFPSQVFWLSYGFLSSLNHLIIWMISNNLLDQQIILLLHRHPSSIKLKFHLHKMLQYRNAAYSKCHLLGNFKSELTIWYFLQLPSNL